MWWLKGGTGEGDGELWRGGALVADIMLEKGGSCDIKKMIKCEKGVRLSAFEDSFWKWNWDDGGKMRMCDERGGGEKGRDMYLPMREECMMKASFTMQGEGGKVMGNDQSSLPSSSQIN